MEKDYDLVERNIVSRKDKEYCLEKVGTKLGAQLECVGRVYDVTIRTVYPDASSNRSSFVANGMYLWVNRSGSLREMSESNIINFPRFARYLVLHDEKDGRTILLYGAQVKNNINSGMKGDGTYRNDWVDPKSLVVSADLSIPMDDIFEAMRFINNDIIGKMYIDEYDELLNAPDETPNTSKPLLENKK